MKIAISLKTKTTDSDVDPRFGRCQFFLIHDTDTESSVIVENPGAEASSGAGVETAAFIANQQVNAVITGNVGPNAYTTLDAAGVAIYAGFSGKADEAVKRCLDGSLTSVQSATVESHHGLKTGTEQKEETSDSSLLIAVTADSDAGLQAPVAHHFGRCPYYTLVSVAGGRVSKAAVVENPFYNAHQPGQVPKFIHEQHADVMIAGGMGGRAVEFFAEYGIEAVTGASGTVEQTIEAYLSGQLTGTAPCSGGHEHGCS